MTTRRTDGFLTLKDMIAGSGCTARTVRYYERQGLLRAARTSGGHRLFSPAELDRLNFIIALREAGWSLEEIAALLGARDGATTDRDALKSLDRTIDAQVQQLAHKLDALTRLQADLKETRQTLAVCRACTEAVAKVTDCAACSRLPRLAGLPHVFRLTRRGDEARHDGPADNGRSLRVHHGAPVDVD